MTYIDTLCHPTDPKIIDKKTIIENALKANISTLGLAGTDHPDWLRQLDLQSSFKDFEFILNFGLHPKWINNDHLNTENQLNLLKENIHLAHGIGEIGLDYFSTTDESLRKAQRDAFELQMQLARDTEKPVVIHMVRAHHHSQGILNKFKGKVRGFLHSFGGKPQLARFYLDAGFHLSIGPHSLRDPNQETIRLIPDDRLLVESDAPQPTPGRKSTTLPENLLLIANIVAEIRGVTAERILEQSKENFRELYKI